MSDGSITPPGKVGNVSYTAGGAKAGQSKPVAASSGGNSGDVSEAQAALETRFAATVASAAGGEFTV